MSKQDLKNIIQRIINHPIADAVKTPQVRIACVASIIRWRPYMNVPENNSELATTPFDFLDQPWVNDCHGQAEMFFIKRADRNGDNWSGHVAFPGGKDEPADQTNLDTVIRETKEEIGIDLDSPEFILLGTLEHRRIKPVNKNTMMILIPYVFLQVAPITPKITIQTTEVAFTHWIPIKYLLENPLVAHSPLEDIVPGPNVKLPWPKDVKVPAIPFLTNEQNPPYLWGMTLRMTQEILATPLSRTVMSAEDEKEYKRSTL